MSKWEDETDNKGAVGLDIKWGIRPNVYMDVTASPDFSEVESDPFIYQLSPYENYLQENRPFFTEGRQYFSCPGRRVRTRVQPVLFAPGPRPEFAAKVSGKTGGFGFGILGAINKEDAGDSYFGVFRVQKDIFKNSQVGFYYAGVRDGAVRNQNVALDYSFNFKDFYYIRGLSAFTFNKRRRTPGTASTSSGSEGAGRRAAGHVGIPADRGRRRHPDGLHRPDRHPVLRPHGGYAWRYNQGPFKRLSFDLGGTVRQDSYGNATGENTEVFLWSEFSNLIEFHGGFELGRSKYQVVDEADDRARLDADYIKTYGGNLDFSWERGGFLKEIGIEGGWEKRGVYNEDLTMVFPGTQTSVEGQLVLRPRSNLEWSFEGDWIRQTVDGTGEEAFNGLAYETALHYQVTRSLFLNTQLFGETRDNQYSLDFLVGYYFGAGNIVQLSFKKSERTDLLARASGYSVTLKVSYLFRV